MTVHCVVIRNGNAVSLAGASGLTAGEVLSMVRAHDYEAVFTTGNIELGEDEQILDDQELIVRPAVVH